MFFIFDLLILYITELGDRGTLHPDGTGILYKKKLANVYKVQIHENS
jgi:hypothetical protein